MYTFVLLYNPVTCFWCRLMWVATGEITYVFRRFFGINCRKKHLNIPYPGDIGYIFHTNIVDTIRNNAQKNQISCMA